MSDWKVNMESTQKWLKVRSGLYRAVGSWLTCAALYAFSSGPCPFCGKAGCPGGAASAGVVGGLIGLGAPLLARIKDWRSSNSIAQGTTSTGSVQSPLSTHEEVQF